MPPQGKRRIIILRLGHRFHRDNRVTTHVCLTARALGAQGVVISDVSDQQLVDTVNRVTENFGGQFTVESGKPWRSTINEWKKSKGKVIHLTAYGIPLPRVIKGLRRSRGDFLVVVGAEKVPGEVFKLADWNVAVTNQPISEVSALGIFLDWLFLHKNLDREPAGGKVRIIPSKHGKRVVNF